LYHYSPVRWASRFSVLSQTVVGATPATLSNDTSFPERLLLRPPPPFSPLRTGVTERVNRIVVGGV
jgi:hypothetical protein